MGEGKKPGKVHLIALAQQFSIPVRKANHIIKDVMDAVQQWPTYAETAGVSASSKSSIARVIVS
jgi:serine/threonine-protein kinase HipA